MTDVDLYGHERITSVEGAHASGLPVCEGKAPKGYTRSEVYCGNCKLFGDDPYPREMMIPRGMPVIDVPCPECGVRLLRKPTMRRWK